MYMERIEKYDRNGPKINSVITINPKALEIAHDLDERFKESGIKGPLHGIPVLLKDNVNTKDMPTTAGSIALEGIIPSEDAFITEKLKKAGAIILAKVNLHEFAVWGETISSVLGQTLNPYDLTRTPGGSSGGTSAGIAADFGIIGLGTDTINSIRSPASACSLVGLRPTVGLISRAGIVPYSLTQDTAGPIMRTVEDTAKVLDIIAGYDPIDPATAWSIGHIPKSYTKYLRKDGLQGKRIGILNSFFGTKNIHKEVNAIIFNCLDDIKKNGGILIHIKEYIDADKLVNEVSVHLHELKPHLNLYLEKLGSKSKVHSLNDIIISGKYHKGIEENIKYAETLDINSDIYNRRLIKRFETQNTVMEIMAKYDLDAIAYPHQKRPVVKIGESQVDRNGVLSSVTGFPSIVVPAGFTQPTDTAPIGVPVGIEFLGRRLSEPILLEIAYAFEQTTKYHKPPVL
ncbi:amidase [Clostridium sp. Cult2]|nr:amidase family protein [Clostridium sp. Cult2]MCF6465445.1 amidase [Clostridium sp. Cult2]